MIDIQYDIHLNYLAYLVDNLFDYVGEIAINVHSPANSKFLLKHRNNRIYRQVILSQTEHGVTDYDNYLMLQMIGYSLDENTIEIIVKTATFGNGKRVSCLGII